ncbi:MAG: methionine synthase [Deltaproteobacteria bacterium]|nr:methionine synthase [Deltaproteobacteria bacterium]
MAHASDLPQLSESAKVLQTLLRERILLFDGAMGTSIQTCQLDAVTFGGLEYEGCNEHLVLTAPKVIADIHEGFLTAGSDIVETNTFGATSIVLSEYGLQDKTLEINRVAAQIAKEVAVRHSTAAKPRFVAGSMGPTTKTISVTGGVNFDQMRNAYAEQAEGLLLGGVDLLVIETVQDTLNLKAGLIGVEEAMRKVGLSVPVLVSGTIETMGTMLAGQGVEALYVSLAHNDLFAIGLNCATGPDFMTDHLRTLAQLSRFPVLCMPNAGLPDDEGRYNETPELIATKLERFVDQGWVNILGGCCGTVPAHLQLLSQMLVGKKPRLIQAPRRSAVSGLEPLVIDEDKRPVLVGERTNVIGSRKFKELVVAGAFEEGAELGRRQVRGGAQVVDVCLADPDRDELEDMNTFLDILVRKVKVPLMIDSTDARVIEASLKQSQGKAIINSINLEDGEERFEKVVPLIRRYGAAVVVGCIDEDPVQGMAVTRQRKLEVARRSYELLTKKYRLAPEDLIFDPLVFPLGTGDQNYIGAGEETIAGVRLIKEMFPECKTILGISNVSFGLPPAGREVLNSVFLYHCVKAGLDMAIVNSEKLERYASIPEEERRLSEDLIYWRGDDPIAAFAAHFRQKKTKEKTDTRKDLPLDERLARCIVEGSKDGLIDDLDEALQHRSPLAIINGPLMVGMDEVGRLFNANELIVAEVLQSAEAMKAAVSHLEPFMEKSSDALKGTLMLATVKGDVHDIGKNLVEIILGNNGYRVINLGIKVPPETLIEAYRTHTPDIIGLSGLLVKSAQQMVVTAQDLNNAGIECPILVGGAALTSRFTAMKIAPEYGGLVCYANDAMQGLDLANQIVDADRRTALIEKITSDRERLAAQERKPVAIVESTEVVAPRVSSVTHNHDIPLPPDLRAHTLDNYDLEAIFAYVNPTMLYGKHLGLKGNLETLLGQRDEKAEQLYRQVRKIEEEVLAHHLLCARAVYRFFPAQSHGDTIQLYNSTGTDVLETFLFPRQAHGEHLCLSDFVAPRDSGRMDYVAMFTVTCGLGVREVSERYKQAGHYLQSHILQALAIESAEGFAELLHQRLREMWGFPDAADITMRERFKARYRGVRVSFGYPACPRLEDQSKLFELLRVTESIDVQLTEGFMMEPEASVSALVFHHPQAKYFSILEDELAAFEKQLAAGA